MSQTRRLRLRDVRNVFRLIGEVREMGADPKVWRPHMVKRLRRLFGAEIVISSEVHAQTTKVPGKLKVIDIGWGCDSEDTLFLDVPLPADLRPGDRLYIGSAGAYTTAYASRFNGFEIPTTHVLGRATSLVAAR